MTASQLAGLLEPRRIRMLDDQAVQLAVGREHIDHGKVGDRGYRELRHRGQRRVVVERAYEDAAGFGQEAQAFFSQLARRDVAREATRVNELTIADEDIGIERDKLDRVVLTTQLGFAVGNALPGAEQRENLFNHGL